MDLQYAWVQPYWYHADCLATCSSGRVRFRVSHQITLLTGLQHLDSCSGRGIVLASIRLPRYSQIPLACWKTSVRNKISDKPYAQPFSVFVRARLHEDTDGLSTQFKKKFILQSALDWKVWVFAFMYIGSLMPVYCFSLFSPTCTCFSCCSRDKTVDHSLYCL